jgi:hypothetical protein
MAIGNIVAGTTGTFSAQLEYADGTPYVPPAGSTYTPEFTWTCSDAAVTVTPAANTQSAVYAVPQSDQAVNMTVEISVAGPGGQQLQAQKTVTLTPAALQLVITQTA